MCSGDLFVISRSTHIGRFQVQVLANTAWALALVTVVQQDAQLLKKITRRAGWGLGVFTTQNLAKAAWALAPAD